MVQNHPGHLGNEAILGPNEAKRSQSIFGSRSERNQRAPRIIRLLADPKTVGFVSQK